MSEKLELGKYEFFPYEFEKEDIDSDEGFEKLKKILKDKKKKNEKVADEFVKTKKRKIMKRNGNH